MSADCDGCAAIVYAINAAVRLYIEYVGPDNDSCGNSILCVSSNVAEERMFFIANNRSSFTFRIFFSQ